MSNDAVGRLYEHVIEGVLSAAQPDFEDTGVDYPTIQELRQVWQQKLSALSVAQMPWEPTPTTTSAPRQEHSLTPVLGSNTSAAVAAPLVPDSRSNDTSGGLVLPGGGIPQTDGADDLPLSREQIDNIISQKANAKEDGKNLVINLTKEKNGQVRIMPQTDGPASDQSDEINSDLDDPEDDIGSGDDEEDDEQNMIMLCLYDKVQRVKNKWKYVLKDGIANINGRDYVFSRASGESEW